MEFVLTIWGLMSAAWFIVALDLAVRGQLSPVETLCTCVIILVWPLALAVVSAIRGYQSYRREQRLAYALSKQTWAVCQDPRTRTESGARVPAYV